MEQNKSYRNLIVKSLFIIGIVIVVFLLTFAMMKVIPVVFSSFANVGESFRNQFDSEKNLKVIAEKTDLRSGEVLIMEWDYSPSESGVYEIQYSCADGLSFELGTAAGNKEIKCNTIYHLNPVTQKISVIPTVTKENILLETTFDIKYVNNIGEAKTGDKVKLTIINRDEGDLVGSGTIVDTEVIDSGQTETRQPADTTGAEVDTRHRDVTPTQPAYVGRPDLRIYNVYTIDDVTIVFSVSNIGFQPTGNWYFNYAMPDGDVQSSPLQPSLRPGEAIRYTVRLSNVPSGDVAIALDPNNRIQELSLINNIAVIEIRGDGGGQYGRRSDRPDLKIADLEVGRISASRFIKDSEIYENDTAAIRFTVRNIGGRNTGTWRFEILNTPYNHQDDFLSERQASLRPGESRQIIVEFTRPDEGRYNIKVELDPRNEIREETTRNNSTSRTLRVLR